MSIRANRSFWPTFLGLSIRQICFGVLLCVVLNYTSAKIPRRVAVIGGGYAGLISARRLLDEGEVTVLLYDMTDHYGGMWYETKEKDKDKYGADIHTSAYKGLQTNSPKENMELPDLSFSPDTKLNPNVGVVNKYLQDYAAKFILNRGVGFIPRLSNMVTNVRPIGDGKWRITSKNYQKEKLEENEDVDVVFVCSGRYSKPSIPNINGINSFQGVNIHTHIFRDADDFRGEVVLVVGGGISGKDMVRLLSKTAREVIFSVRPEQKEISEILCTGNCRVVTEIREFKDGKFFFIDDSSAEVGAIIFATGYEYSYPFLQPNTGITYSEKSIQSLYRDIFNIEHPTTMVFIGVNGVVMVPFYDLEVRYAMEFIFGRKRLPTKNVMRTNNNRDSLNSGVPVIYADMLLDEAGISNISPVLKKMGVKSCMDIESCAGFMFCKDEISCKPFEKCKGFKECMQKMIKSVKTFDYKKCLKSVICRR